MNKLMPVFAAVLAAAIASTAAVAQQTPIKIGFITELTGPWTFFGNSCVQGMKMATDEINATGGVLNRPLEFVVVDDQTNPAQALAAARNLDVNDKVVAITGTTSSDVALALYGYAEQQKLPFLAPVAAFPQLTKPGTRYTFRLEPDAAGWGYALAKFVEHRKPGAKIAIMYSDAALMRAIVAGLKYQAPLSKLNIVSEIMFPAGSSDATVQAAQVKTANPDFVVVTGAGAFDNILTNQLIDLGIAPSQIIHPFGTSTQVFGWGQRSAGSFYGSFFDQGMDNLTPAGKLFISKYNTAHGRPAAFAENFCYVTPYLFKEALTKAGVVDREKVRQALSQLKMKEPTSGVPIEFDKNGARKAYIYFLQMQTVEGKKGYKSKQVFYEEWDPEVIPVYQLVK